MCFLKWSDINLLTIHFRFSLRLMLAGSSAMYTITFLAIRAQRFEPTPQVLHDRDPTVNPRQSRHNKAIASRHSVWQFLMLYFFAGVLMLLSGSAKGTDYLNCCLWLPKNQRGCHENMTTWLWFFHISAGQTMKQMDLWCFNSFVHIFVLQLYILVTNKEARTHLWRALKNNRPEPHPQACG